MKYEEVFKPQAAMFFSAHRRTPTGGQVAEIWQRVQSLPDAFMIWAAGQLRDSATLPGNLGLHLEKTLWPQWRKLNPDKCARQEVGGCADCSGRHDDPGYGFYASWDGDWRLRFFPCRCNPLLRGSQRSFTRAQLDGTGWTPIPENFAGTRMEYEYRLRHGRDFEFTRVKPDIFNGVAEKCRAEMAQPQLQARIDCPW